MVDVSSDIGNSVPINGEFGELRIPSFDLVSISLQLIKVGGREAAECDR